MTAKNLKIGQLFTIKGTDSVYQLNSFFSTPEQLECDSVNIRTGERRTFSEDDKVKKFVFQPSKDNKFYR